MSDVVVKLGKPSPNIRVESLDGETLCTFTVSEIIGSLSDNTPDNIAIVRKLIAMKSPSAQVTDEHVAIIIEAAAGLYEQQKKSCTRLASSEDSGSTPVS